MYDIILQLVEIYQKYEREVCNNKMSLSEAITYHKHLLELGRIYPVLRNGKVVGYYERYFKGNECVVTNVFVKEEYRGNGVLKELKRHFYDTLPSNITKLSGNKYKFNNKRVEYERN